MLDTIKRAEDEHAVTLRLYEAHGARGSARVRVEVPFVWARRATALEDGGYALEAEGRTVLVPYRPHEIVTIKMAPA